MSALFLDRAGKPPLRLERPADGELVHVPDEACPNCGHPLFLAGGDLRTRGRGVDRVQWSAVACANCRHAIGELQVSALEVPA